MGTSKNGTGIPESPNAKSSSHFRNFGQEITWMEDLLRLTASLERLEWRLIRQAAEESRDETCDAGQLPAAS